MQVHFWAPPQENGAKTCKISVDLYNLRGSDFDCEYLWNTAQDIENRKANISKSIPPAFFEKGPANFGPLITEM